MIFAGRFDKKIILSANSIASSKSWVTKIIIGLFFFHNCINSFLSEFEIFLSKISKKIKTITKKYKVKLIINDFPIIAKKSNADGCHLGQGDWNIKNARKLLKNKILENVSKGIFPGQYS